MPHHPNQPVTKHESNKNSSQAIQKHPLHVSGELRWFWSYDLAVMLVGHLDSVSKLGWLSWIFNMLHHPNQPVAADMDPIITLPKPSKSIHWMYQVN
jgi:hypothetical protein